MSFEILESDRKKRGKCTGRYVQEVREIVKGQLNRRELLRIGLLAGVTGCEEVGIELSGS